MGDNPRNNNLEGILLYEQLYRAILMKNLDE